MKILSKTISFLFPPECLGCSQEGNFVCQKCVNLIPRKVSKRSFDLKYFEKIWVLTDYENPIVEKSIAQFKFKLSKKILDDLSLFFEKSLPKKKIPEGAIFVPVPLHPFRQNKRGYNQSLLLAETFSNICFGENRVQNILKRIRNTRQQVKLSKAERKENVKNAFQVDTQKTKIPLKTPIILIDDVATTGSTLLECAKALKQYGYDYVWGLVIARGR